MDLFWTRHVACPTVAEYLDMIDHKTGGLFCMVAGLMQAEGCISNRELPINRMMTLLGRYFQIRDDYQNLASADYTAAKGFCEDLDEGKFSLPLIHTLRSSTNTQQQLLRDILQERRHQNGGMPLETKNLVVKMMQDSGSLVYVKKVLKELEEAIQVEITTIERSAGEENFVLRLLIEKLRIE